MVKAKGIQILYALTMLHFMAIPIANKYLMLATRLMALTIIVLLVIQKMREGGITRLNCWMLVAFVCVVVMNLTRSIMSINFDLILSIVSVLMLLLSVVCAQHFHVDDSMRKFFLNWSCVCAAAMKLYSYTPYGYRVDNRTIQYLTLNTGNANTAAVYLFLLYCIILITMPRKLKGAIIPVIIEIALIDLIAKTGARAVVVALVAVTVYYLFFRRFKISKWIVFAGMLAPVVFVPMYLYMADSISNTADWLGKSLFTGREDIYRYTLKNISSMVAWLIGDFKLSPLNNAHNGFLSILASTGGIGAIAFYTIMYGQLLKANKYVTTGMANTAIAVLLGCYIHTCGESALVLGGFPGITLMFIFYILAFDTSASEG